MWIRLSEMCVVVCVLMFQTATHGTGKAWAVSRAADVLKRGNKKNQSSPASELQWDNDSAHVNKLIKRHAWLHTSTSLQSCKVQCVFLLFWEPSGPPAAASAQGQRRPEGNATIITLQRGSTCSSLPLWHGNSVRLQPIRAIKTAFPWSAALKSDTIPSSTLRWQ